MAVNSVLSHLGLVAWPFTVVPQPDRCTFIADRHQLREDTDQLMSRLSRHDDSEINLLWSSLGAGKTHTLYYIANRSRAVGGSEASNALWPIYTEFPRAARSFLDVYRAFAHEIDPEWLVEAYLEIVTSARSAEYQRRLMQTSPDFFNALRALAQGTPERQLTALRWLRGDQLPVAEFREIGVSQRLRSADDAVQLIAALIGLLRDAAISSGRRGGTVIWILDEYQRVAGTGRRLTDEINGGLHAVFNRCPAGLSLFFSFSGKPERQLPPWFSPELRDRIGRTKVMLLPPMLHEDAERFVLDVLAQYRPADFNNQSPYFPFSQESCREIIDEVHKSGEIRPRSIMQAFAVAFEAADPLIESGSETEVTPRVARAALADRVAFEPSEEE